MYSRYKIERRDGDVFIYAPFRPPSPEPARIRHRQPDDLGLKRYYAPLRDYPDLFLRFASLFDKVPLTEDATLETVRGWVESYGTLGLGGIDYLEIPERRADNRMGRRESVAAFSEEVLNAAEVLELYEAAVAEGAPDSRLKQVLEKWDYPEHELSLERQREFALRFVWDRVGSRISRECYPVLYRTIRKDDGKTLGFEQGFGFRSLLGAMYLQMMSVLIEGDTARRCARRGCPRIISFEPPQDSDDSPKRGGARGKYRTRRDKKYCSSACRQWVYDNT